MSTISETDLNNANAELLEWLRIPSVSTLIEHKPDMQRAAEWLSTKLEKIGFTSEILPTAGHSVVYAERKSSNSSAPTVLLYGHYDVQPVDPLNEWDTPPFEPDIRDGQIFARGSTDDKGQVFAHVKALEFYLRSRRFANQPQNFDRGRRGNWQPKPNPIYRSSQAKTRV